MRKRRSQRSPRALRGAAAHKNEYGYRGPQFISPRAPPVALGPPPRVLTPCWLPEHRGHAMGTLTPSPLEQLKARRRASRLFKPKNNTALVLGACFQTRAEKKKAARDFFNAGKEPIGRLLPHLNTLSQAQVEDRLSTARNFPFVMEKLQAKRLNERLRSGHECRNLVDPSAKAWGDSSPRFVRTRGAPLRLSVLTYRASRPSIYGSAVDSMFVS